MQSESLLPIDIYKQKLFYKQTFGTITDSNIYFFFAAYGLLESYAISLLSKKNIELREKNLNQFIKNGFPNKKIENWKFSDLNQIISSNIKDLGFYNNVDLSVNINQSIYINNFEHNKIVFINGAITNVDFNSEEKDKIEIIKSLDFKDDFISSNPLVSLNSALISNYIKIIVKENYSLNKPLIIYNITNKDLRSKAINLRTDISL